MHIKNNISPAVISGLLFFFSLTLLTGEAAEYPSRPITAISPFAPGGLYDIVGRPFTVFAEKRRSACRRIYFVLWWICHAFSSAMVSH